MHEHKITQCLSMESTPYERAAIPASSYMYAMNESKRN